MSREFYVSVFLLCLCLSEHVSGRVIFQDDFDHHTLGSIRFKFPQIGPRWISTSPNSEFATVVSVNGSDKELRMNGLPGSGTPYVYADLLSYAPIIQMTFDLRISPNTDFGGSNVLAIDTDRGLRGFVVSRNGLGRTGGFFSIPRDPAGGQYRISTTLYFDLDEMDIWIDDLSTPVVGDGEHRGRITPINHMIGFDFEMPYNQTGSLYIDNFSIVTIPEPGSALIAWSMLAMLLTRRNRDVAACRFPTVLWLG